MANLINFIMKLYLWKSKSKMKSWSTDRIWKTWRSLRTCCWNYFKKMKMKEISWSTKWPISPIKKIFNCLRLRKSKRSYSTALNWLTGLKILRRKNRNWSSPALTIKKNKCSSMNSYGLNSRTSRKDQG